MFQEQGDHHDDIHYAHIHSIQQPFAPPSHDDAEQQLLVTVQILSTMSKLTKYVYYRVAY